jgi:hypothetical protein
MQLLKYLNIELTILKTEFKDAIVSSHKDDILKKIDAIHSLIDLYERA